MNLAEVLSEWWPTPREDAAAALAPPASADRPAAGTVVSEFLIAYLKPREVIRSSARRMSLKSS